MTTIAYRDGVLAADTLICESDRRVGRVVKIMRRAGILAGVAGCLAHMQAFHSWFMGGMIGEPPAMKTGERTSDAIIVHDGRILGLGELGWDVMKANYYAIGSGAGVALGAMASGATAEQAVQAAIELDVWSGGDITVLSRVHQK